VLAVFSYFYSNDYFFRFAFLPFFTNRFTVEGYTLFSLKHIVDYFNLLLLLLPGLPLVVAILFFLPLRRIFKQREYRYLLILVLSTLGAVFIFDPKLGMPRDWDLFSFSGVPLAVFGYFLILSKRKFMKSYMTVSLLSVVLAVLVLLPRATSQAVPETSLAHFKDYLRLDNEKNRTAYTILFDYYKSLGDFELAVKVKQERNETFPEVLLIEEGIAQANQGNTLAALKLQRRALILNPVFTDAYAHLGATFAGLGQNDSALYYLEIARGLNPYDTSVLFNIGVTSIKIGHYKAGRQALSEAARVDPKIYQAYGQLLVLAVNIGEIEESVGYFQQLMSNPEVPFDYLRGIGNLYLSRQQYKYAATAYRVALQRGLDSMYVKKLMEEHPPLREQFLNQSGL
jgi:Tfp pilus assembly protein PilF